MLTINFYPIILFIFNSPQEWIVVIVAVALLFGAKRLPELAKSIGQARNEFKKGLKEAEDEDASDKSAVAPPNKPNLANLDDESLIEELRRRKEKQLTSSSE